MKIIADKHIQYVSDYFAAQGELILKAGRDITPDDVKDADILLVRSITQVNEKLLKHSTVKFVGSMTAGKDHLDTAWLDQHHIAWSASEGFNAPPVADYVVSVIAALQMQGKLLSPNLNAAVIGVGHVGKLVAKHLTALGFFVTLCDPLRALNESDFHSTPLNQLENMDLICVHVPLTRQGSFATYHILDNGFLSRQKNHCVLINASRGAVLDSAAYLAHAQKLNCALDVWESEPNINLNVLNAVQIATPHIAGYSVQSKIRGIEQIYQAAFNDGFLIKKILPSQSLLKIDIETKAKNWQEFVLEIFNPLEMTEKMKRVLNQINHVAGVFDEMRNEFSSRNELSFLRVCAKHFSIQDISILEKIGVDVLKL